MLFNRRYGKMVPSEAADFLFVYKSLFADVCFCKCQMMEINLILFKYKIKDIFN